MRSRPYCHALVHALVHTLIHALVHALVRALLSPDQSAAHEYLDLFIGYQPSRYAVGETSVRRNEWKLSGKLGDSLPTGGFSLIGAGIYLIIMDCPTCMHRELSTDHLGICCCGVLVPLRKCGPMWMKG